MKKHFAYPQEPEATVGDAFVCGGCGSTQADPLSAGYDVPELGQRLCTDCFNAYHSEINDEAEAYAQSHCVITSRPDRIGRTEDSPSPPRSLAFLLERRSDCTNYEDLIRRFSTPADSLANSLYREAIERRCLQLIEDEAT